jgi:hypothetical protein
MLRNYLFKKLIAGSVSLLFLAMSFNHVLSQQDTDPPGGVPYPMATATMGRTQVGTPYPGGEPYPVTTLPSEERPVNTPTPTSSVEEDPDGPTPTLIPLPPFTLEFPVFSPTPSPTPTAASIGILNQENDIIQQVDERIDSQIESIGVLIVTIWLLLGAFLILYLKRVGY